MTKSGTQPGAGSAVSAAAGTDREKQGVSDCAESLRAIGLDYGSKTVGVAGSDGLGITAQGVEIIRRKSENKLRRTLARITEIAEERGARVVVLGLPLGLRGRVTERTYRTLQFREMLRRRLPSRRVILWDERLTTVAADRTMAETGIRVEDRREFVDEIAAMLILQGYLDCVRSGKEVPAVDAEKLMREYEAGQAAGGEMKPADEGAVE